jgi:predicted DNA-binding protein
MRNDEHITIRIPKELKEKLQKRAEREHRTLSNFVKKELHRIAKEEDR